MPAPTYSADVLRNVGAPVVLAVLGDDGLPRRNADGSHVTELGHVRFDMNGIADLEARFNGVEAPDGAQLMGELSLPTSAWGPERRFYGLEAWQVSTRLLPFQAVRAAMAIGLGCSESEAGARMVQDDGVTPYMTAVMAAFAVANGEDPQMVAEGSNRALAPAAEPDPERTPETPNPSPSQPGSPAGSEGDTTPIGSGT